MWDVFLSYSRGDVERVRPLAQVLRDGGLEVFTDETEVASFAGISDTIRRELARSKALLAYYSTGYPEREACQWELTTAYLAGLGEGDPRGRVMVVNPEATSDHIHPVELRDARHASADDPAALVADVREHVARLDGSMAIQERAVRRWLLGSPEPRLDFLGRLSELWQVHSALHAHSAPLVTGRDAPRAVQIRGMAGIGKSALAQEYALRFEAAYPGGVFWVSGQAYDDSVRALSDSAATSFGADGPFLWIVDSVPADRLTARDIAAMAAPHPRGRTVFTLRSRAYAGIGTPVDLEPLDALHARVLVGGDEALAEAVEGHPLALGLLGRAIRAGHRPRELYDRLHARGGSLLDTLAGTDVTGALVRDVDTAEAADVLRCAAVLHPLPLTVEDAERVLAAVDRVPRAVAARRAGNGVAELRVRGLLAPVADGGWRLHPVTLHAWHHHDPALLQHGLDAADFDEQSGSEIVDRTKTAGDAVTPAQGGTAELVYRHGDFGTGVTEVTVEVAGEGVVELSLDGGPALAQLALPAPTSGPYDYTTLAAGIVAEGVHDVHLKLRGPLRLAHVGFFG